MIFNIVYGNHGHSSHGAENNLTYLYACLRTTGRFVRLSRGPLAGAVNFILESFTPGFEDACIEALEKSARTKFIVVVTEWIHQGGFWPGTTTPFADEANRFEALKRGLRLATAIWCLYREQLSQYPLITDCKTILHLPHGYVEGFYDFVRHDEDRRDIDFFFSGSMTPYRHAIMAKLAAAKFHCHFIPPDTVSLIRNDAIARSKVCLALRQTETWNAPSPSRIHYHLMAGSYLLAEQCEYPSELDDYIELVETDQLVEVCIEAAMSGATARLGRERHDRFREETAIKGRIEPLLERSLG